jgi:DNA-binding transcriptional ArsR family regulator
MNTLAALFSSRVKAEVLRLLFGPAARELHLRELERQTKLSVSTVRQELKRLSHAGIVNIRRDGNRTYFSANKTHPVYSALRDLVLKTGGLADVLRRALKHPQIRLAFVFGSLAAGTEQAHSDIDLMVLGDLGLRKLSGLTYGLSVELGREVNPHVLRVEEFVRRKKTRDHFVTSVLAAPKFFVVGDEHELERLGS